MNEDRMTNLSAIPCGRRADGGPLQRRTFEVIHSEVWGDGRTRFYVEHRMPSGAKVTAPLLVYTDSVHTSDHDGDLDTDALRREIEEGSRV